MDSIPGPDTLARMHEILLLVLILFSDPSSEASATLLRDDLIQRGGPGVVVVIGPEALKKLESLGLRDGDLVGSPRLGEHLTEQDRKTVIIRLDGHESGGDRMIDSRVWVAGRCERHTAIGGKGADPSPAVLSGVVQILTPWLPATTTPAVAAGGDLPALVQRQDWREVVARLGAKTDKDAREFYYLVKAQASLRDSAASDTVAAMEKAYPGHFLFTAAKNLLPAEQVPEKSPMQDPTSGSKVMPAK